MLAGVHIPKTGSTSLRYTLTEHFDNSLHLIYGEKPMNDAPETRYKKLKVLAESELHNKYTGIDCIYGHFLPYRFNLLAKQREIKFFIWFRHPVQRCISTYYHIINNAQSLRDRPFSRSVIHEKWNINKFIMSQNMQNFYSQYLWSFPLETFSFIGAMEYYENDFDCFCKMYLGKSYKLNYMNKGAYEDCNTGLDPDFLRKAELFHQKDMDLYYRALDLREKKLSQESR